MKSPESQVHAAEQPEVETLSWVGRRRMQRISGLASSLSTLACTLAGLPLLKGTSVHQSKGSTSFHSVFRVYWDLG